MYLKTKFPGVSDAKNQRKYIFLLHQGLGSWWETSNLMKDSMILKNLHGCHLRKFAQILWGNHRANNYSDIVKDLMTSYKNLGCNMNLKIHFQDSPLDFFLANLGALSYQSLLFETPPHGWLFQVLTYLKGTVHPYSLKINFLALGSPSQAPPPPW